MQIFILVYGILKNLLKDYFSLKRIKSVADNRSSELQSTIDQQI